MAFTSGVHILCGFVDTTGEASLLGQFVWSQTMASAGTTTRAAPTRGDNDFARGGADLCFEIAAGVDAFVAIGPTPDATAGARMLVRGGDTRNVLCDPGDKVAWVAA